MSTNTPENPYLAGRREWNERYGSYIAAARTWQIAAFGSLGVALLAVAGVAYIGAQNRIVPYVVEVNKSGDPVTVRRADQAQPQDTRVVKASLGRFIHNWRSVTADSAVARRNVMELYGMLSSSDPATATLNEYMAKNSPFQRAATETVTVEITSIVPVSGETWQIDWTETRRDRRGMEIDVTTWRASPGVAFRPPATEPEILKNPIGIYIKEIAWAQQITTSTAK